MNVKMEDWMRGRGVFVIQPTCPPVNEHLMELFIILDALRRASAGRVTAVLPYCGCARKERKSQPRGAVSAQLGAQFLPPGVRAPRLLVRPAAQAHIRLSD